MRAVLIDGRKTQTRRILKPQPYPLEGRAGFWNASGCVGGCICISDRALLDLHRKPKRGDRLWVREAWSSRGQGVWTVADARRYGPGGALYRADGGYTNAQWWPSIHMPREFSRLTLTVTDVRVQRLQDISEADAMAEGATSRPSCSGFMGREDGWSMDWSRVGQMSRYAMRPPGGPAKVPLKETDISLCDPQMAFASYWNDMHRSGAWDQNPWVCAVSFLTERKNIDHD